MSCSVIALTEKMQMTYFISFSLPGQNFIKSHCKMTDTHLHLLTGSDCLQISAVSQSEGGWTGAAGQSR